MRAKIYDVRRNESPGSTSWHIIGVSLPNSVVSLTSWERSKLLRRGFVNLIESNIDIVNHLLFDFWAQAWAQFGRLH